MSTIHNVFQKIEVEVILPHLPYKASISLLLKPDNVLVRQKKKNDRSISLSSISEITMKF
jgi:hypothetical protein